MICNYLRLEAGPTGIKSGVVQVAGELFTEVALDVSPGAEPLQLVSQPSVRTLTIARSLRLQILLRFRLGIQTGKIYRVVYSIIGIV